MKKIWTVVGGTVLAAGVLAPWGVGMLTEQQWQDVTQRVNDAQVYVQFDTASYDRNFYSAKINGVVRVFDPVSGHEEVLPYEADVAHGITGSFMDFSFTEELPMAASAELAKVFPEERPSLTLDAKVWGTATLEAKVPAIDYTEAETAETLRMDASFARLVVSGGGDDAEVTVSWPALSMNIPDALQVTVDKLYIDQKMSLTNGHLWTGDGDLEFARIKIAEYDSAPLIFEDFQLTSKTHNDSDDSFSTVTIASLGKVTADGTSNGPHRIEFAASGVNIEAWNELATSLSALQALQQAGAGDKNPQAAFQQQMMLYAQVSESAKKLAVNGMSVGFPAVSLDSPEGKLQGKLLLGHPKLDKVEQEQVTLVMERLEGDMSFRLPVALTQRYPELGELIMPLVFQGLMVEDNGEFHLDARLKDLTVDVNGNKFPLPPLI